jgi:hypothetical protein
MFNLLLLLEYLIYGEESCLLADHMVVIRKFVNLIGERNIQFNHTVLNQIHSARDILSWTIPTGNNVVRNNRNYQLLSKQLLKKLVEYKKEEYKRRHQIKTLREPKLSSFLDSSSTNLCEFFYWYRIKANYRDMEFVDSGASINDFVDFYTNYYQLTQNFFSALKNQINVFSLMRLNREIL